LTPIAENRADAVARVQRVWEHCGAEVVTMAADHHDNVLAATSHLPHLLAYALVNTLLQLDDSEEIFRFAAGGFRDFSRIASSDPVMWRDICLANRASILAVLDEFSHAIKGLRDSINQSDEDQLRLYFSRAKDVRDRVI